jgi:glycosyltransferase involved in cell wall biosynthesis
LRIVVDARGLKVSGIGRYLDEILKTLVADARFSQLVLLGRPDVMAELVPFEGAGDRIAHIPFPFDFYSPAAQLAWIQLRARGIARGDVFFFPHYDAPLARFPTSSVVTVHDLIHFKVPDVFAPWRRAAASILLRNAVHRAVRVVTVSEAAKRDVVERFPGSASKIEVVHNGVSPFFHRNGDVPERSPVREPYLLCVGNRKPHKNLIAAVEVLALAAGEIPDLRLTIIGPRAPEWDRVLARAEELGVHRRIVELEGVTDEELRDFYLNALALLFPSFYEGFGLPALEAMSCGVPVIASNRASLPEVVGSAGILVDPNDHVAMAQSAIRLWRDPTFRSDLGRQGVERAARFTWSRSTARTADLLYEVGASGRAGT